MHHLPSDHDDLRIIDSDRVCDAIAALGDRQAVLDWAGRFELLSDPTRLALLVCIHRVGPISVSDLAAATGNTDSTTSQALRHLRSRGAVNTQRAGRVIRYTLADSSLAPLLESVNPAPVLHHAH